MKLAVISGLFYGLCLAAIAAAFDIQDQQLTPTGESENRSIPFVIVKEGAKIMLPVRSLYTRRVFNQIHTIAAINYHETSDYDGVDLVVSSGEKISVLSNIWNLIEATVEKKRYSPFNDGAVSSSR